MNFKSIAVTLALTVAVASPIVAGAVGTTTQTADRMAGEFIYLGGDPAPPTAAEVCNNLIYVAYDPYPVVGCYQAVAREQGWSEEKIAAWQPFLITEMSGVTQKESVQCWNLRHNDYVYAGQPCTSVTRRNNAGSDTGWGQVTSIWYRGSDTYLCKNWGICSQWQIIQDPYHSMRFSIIEPVDMPGPYGGSRPWCFTRPWDAYTFHECWEAPDR